MLKPYKTRMYRVRDYGCGRFIALPPEAQGYEYYDCHENPHVPGDFVYTPVKSSIIKQPEPVLVEESFYEQE
jgi:hypothetical protein